MAEWMRLFPVPYRFLDPDKRFRKYQWVDVTVSKANDHRVESYKIENNGIVIVTEPLPTDHGWLARREIVQPLVKPSLCWLQRERDRCQQPTLGIFRPKQIRRLVIEREPQLEWSEAELPILRRRTLFNETPSPKTELVKVPFKFSYDFECHDDCQRPGRSHGRVRPHPRISRQLHRAVGVAGSGKYDAVMRRSTLRTCWLWTAGLVVFLGSAAGAQQASGGSWLDRPLTSWNMPGAAIPSPRAAEEDKAAAIERCGLKPPAGT
ncbi:MAG: hypothetical protein ACRD1U_01585, partial [Vicinamibacterales bacterium]